MVCNSHSCRIISAIVYILVILTNAGILDIMDLITAGTVVQISEQSSVKFMFMGPCILNPCQQLSNKMRPRTVYYISVNCSTCFGW